MSSRGGGSRQPSYHDGNPSQNAFYLAVSRIVNPYMAEAAAMAEAADGTAHTAEDAQRVVQRLQQLFFERAQSGELMEFLNNMDASAWVRQLLERLKEQLSMELQARLADQEEEELAAAQALWNADPLTNYPDVAPPGQRDREHVEGERLAEADRIRRMHRTARRGGHEDELDELLSMLRPEGRQISKVARQKAKDAAAAAKAAAQTDDGEAAEHVMLSYNWDHQPTIKRINTALAGIPVHAPSASLTRPSL